jgi:hypothetical protein
MARGQQQEHIPIPIKGVKHTTPKAVLIEYFDCDLNKLRGVWVPRSQLFEGEDVAVDPELMELNISPWFCDKENLE